MSIEVITFGCRLNAFESEVIAREAENAGLDQAIVINSCAVTSEAVAQARQQIRKLKRERPEARIVVTGCAAQTDPAMFATMPEVTRVIGNDEKLTRQVWQRSGDEKIAVGDIMRSTSIAAASARRCRRFMRLRMRSSPACSDKCRCGISRGSFASASRSS